MLVPEDQLPLELSIGDAVAAAYSAELARIDVALGRRLPVLVECEKELVPWLYKAIRDRLKARGTRCVYLDGRPPPDAPPPPMPMGLLATMVSQLRDVVRGGAGDRVIVMPHLDLLTTSSGGLTAEAREVIPLLYENPEILWIGFKDPAFALPEPITNLFPRHESLFGVPRDRLRHLVTRREARKLGKTFDPFDLYRHVSGVNAVRLRRLLSSLEAEDYPEDARPAFAQLRAATLGPTLTLPEIDLRRDIGGYAKVKDRLEREILDVLARKSALADDEAKKRLESLVPRGMIFWGPPGTGKTLFAKAMATALGAAVTIVNGPELKSRWVGESEERIRQVFVRARQSAPAVIVFDELDSFASARGTYTGSGVEHSMVNQLLGEMDGFRKDELVFVVGTTNFVEALDPALLRPGRFEFHLQIPWPDAEDRRAILSIYDRKLDLKMSERALAYAVKRTGDLLEGSAASVSGPSRYSGDHLQALGRQLARTRLRDGAEGTTEVDDVERALTAYLERPALTPSEERVVATHEAGHAVCAMHAPHAPPIDRISIRGDVGGALGFVQYADPAHRYVVTQRQLLDSICVLFGGREAEALLLDDLSAGAAHDLERAADIARALVTRLGFGGDELGSRSFGDEAIGDATRTRIDERVRAILEEQRLRARDLLAARRDVLVSLRDLLLERKVLDREAFAHLVLLLVYSGGPMAHVTIRLDVDPTSRRRTIVVSYESDPDALPTEHEEEHRAILRKLVEGGVVSAEEAGRVQVERARGHEAGAATDDAAPIDQRRPIDERR
jgi:cell division protease FtsH